MDFSVASSLRTLSAAPLKGFTNEILDNLLGDCEQALAAGLTTFGVVRGGVMEWRGHIATSFYKKNATWMKDKDIPSEVAGINRTKSVTVGETRVGDRFSQWQKPGGQQGSYYADQGVGPEGLGILPTGKVRTDYVSIAPSPSLRSTAADVRVTWEGGPPGGTPASGGEMQTFATNRTAFSAQPPLVSP